MDKKHLFSQLLNKAVSMAMWTKAGLCVKSLLLEQSLPRTPSRPITSVASVAKNPPAPAILRQGSNQRNPRLINYLYALGIFTTVKNPLQIRPFMQNEPNFQKSQMYVNKVITREYEKKDTWWSGKNKPKTNPIKANSNPIKANIMPKQTQFKPNQTQFLPAICVAGQTQKNAAASRMGQKTRQETVSYSQNGECRYNYRCQLKEKGI